ncbi:MAG: hypothetical protein E6R03_14000 [Hyphomicrobiaceae bacterium]|nr:MAG: hypothetical protein E6R03_14000 [Hyphomicrobiaceae bacterium]
MDGLDSVVVRVTVERETDKALLVRCGHYMPNVWVPKSQIRKTLKLLNGVKILTIPVWLTWKRHALVPWLDFLNRKPNPRGWGWLQDVWLKLAKQYGVCVCAAEAARERESITRSNTLLL